MNELGCIAQNKNQFCFVTNKIFSHLYDDFSYFIYSFIFLFKFFFVCVCEREIFRLHISVDGHLGFFHILAIANNVTMNVGVHISFRVSVLVFFRYITRSGITRSYGSSILSFLRHLHTVFTVAAPIYIPINSVQGFLLLHILDNLLCSF